jgi:hypothetical protein
VFLIFCSLVWLRVWTYLFIQVSANKHDIFFLLCIAKSLDLEALVLIMGGRDTEHQNAQTRKIFSCLLRCRDFLGLWTGWNNFDLKGKNRTEINRFELIFGLVRLKKFNLIVYFDSKPDRTGNPQPLKKRKAAPRPTMHLHYHCSGPASPIVSRTIAWHSLAL